MSTSVGCFSKDVWQTRCRPSQPTLCVEVVGFALDAVSEDLKVYPQLKLKVYVDKNHVNGKNREVLQAVPKVVSKLRSVIQEARLKLPLREGGTQGKGKLFASNEFFESRFSGYVKSKGIGVAETVVWT